MSRSRLVEKALCARVGRVVVKMTCAALDPSNVAVAWAGFVRLKAPQQPGRVRKQTTSDIFP
jgi:hypothetical protein